LSRQTDGTFVARRDSTSVLFFDGEESRVVSTEEWTYAVAPPFALVRVEATLTRTRGSPRHTLLIRKGDTWTLTTTRGSYTHVKRMAPLD
jgi:hypothetical protein